MYCIIVSYCIVLYSSILLYMYSCKCITINLLNLLLTDELRNWSTHMQQENCRQQTLPRLCNHTLNSIYFLNLNPINAKLTLLSYVHVQGQIYFYRGPVQKICGPFHCLVYLSVVTFMIIVIYIYLNDWLLTWVLLLLLSCIVLLYCIVCYSSPNRTMPTQYKYTEAVEVKPTESTDSY